MKQVIEKKDCCGCAACVNICPHNAISMVENYEGFLYPEIDEAKCVSCGLCQKACPVLSKDNNNFKKPDCYAVMADDETRKVSSSGGAFSILADYILDKKGYICGCTFDKSELKAKHIIINLKEDLYKLRGSKYVQSDIGTSYLDVKKLLENGNFVLFSGTPCQVAGLKSFLRKDYENLLTVDILCHGVPSPKVHRKYLNELLKSRDEKVINVNFRDKVRGWSPILTHTTTTTTTTYSYIQVDDTYMQLFLNNISLRKNCTDCKFCSTQRPGDFTIADFWGIENFDKNLNDGKGTSLVLVNNIKAKNIYERLSEKFQLSKSVPLKYAILGNRNLYSPHKIHPKREEFFNDLDKYNLKQLVNKYLYDKYDCGIMNMFNSVNCGAMLTCYALQETLKMLGYTVSVIDFGYWNKEYRKSTHINFAKKYLNTTKMFKSAKSLAETNNIFDNFIVGSDQIFRYWNGNFNYLYYLDFVENNKKKIACAASFGINRFEAPEKYRIFYEYYLNRFDSISVREDSGITICKESFNKDVVRILDPVFLIDKAKYEEIISTSRLQYDNYILHYVISNSNIDNFIDQLAKLYKCNIIKVHKNEKIEDWLYLIKNAKLIVTDSFHGTCFSIIFNKDFVCYPTVQDGAERLSSLLNIFGLQENIYYDFKNIENICKIDYKNVNNVIQKEKNRSIMWLNSELQKEKNVFDESIENRIIFELLKNNNRIINYPRKSIYKRIYNKLIKNFKSFFKSLKFLIRFLKY